MNDVAAGVIAKNLQTLANLAEQIKNALQRSNEIAMAALTPEQRESLNRMKKPGQ